MDDFVQEVPPSSATDGYTVDALSASALLGVNRTRLSQLTSKGVFPYQRRRVGTRLRLFYRHSDLENYLESQHRPHAPTQRMIAPSERERKGARFHTSDAHQEQETRFNPFFSEKNQDGLNDVSQNFSEASPLSRPSRPTYSESKLAVVPPDLKSAVGISEHRNAIYLLERLTAAVEQLASTQEEIKERLRRLELRAQLTPTNKQSEFPIEMGMPRLRSASDVARRR